MDIIEGVLSQNQQIQKTIDEIELLKRQMVMINDWKGKHIVNELEMALREVMDANKRVMLWTKQLEGHCNSIKDAYED